jgi:hypothetical protein
MGGQAAMNKLPHGYYANVTSTGGVGANGDAANGGFGVNYFQNAASAFAQFRPFILGVDQNGLGNGGPVTNPNDWNLNFTIAKDINIRESMGLTFTAAFFNALNHTNWSAGGWSLQDSADFGLLSPSNSPRTIELGLRFHF